MVDALAAEAVATGRTALGIEFGSTRIKAVLVDSGGNPLASGSQAWENRLQDGLWTYDWDQVWQGLRDAYADLARDVRTRFEVDLTTVGSLAVSAMMHGYIALGSDQQPLVPFRTWRNTNTTVASEELSREFSVNIPLRWSIAHLYQAIIDGEGHLSQIHHITTLAGLVHERLTGEQVLGVGDASGMFPIDSETGDYDQALIERFNDLAAARGFARGDVRALLPRVLLAGDTAGHLTAEGARLLDPTGNLQPGIPVAPPEGDAGTGMVATNAVAVRTGNVSAGTSIFAMVVLDKALVGLFPEVDPVCTPDGLPVAMVHSNNGTSEWDQWTAVFAEFASKAGLDIPKSEIYDLLYQQAFAGAEDGGGLLAYNLLSGEPIVGLEEGRPLFVRSQDSPITLANFMRVQLMTIFASLRLGLDILRGQGVQLDKLNAHGGLFKTPVVAQSIMASALKVPVEVGEAAGEGGPWGAALLALYSSREDRSVLLPQFLAGVFAGATRRVIDPLPKNEAGFDNFLRRYTLGIAVVKAAIEHT